MPRRARRAEQDAEAQHAAREEDDVLSRDRQQVVEPRPPEARLERGREPVVVPEQHAFEDRAPFSRETGRRGAAQPAADPVGDPAEPAPSPDDVPLVDVKDDVDTLAAEIGALVETVRRTAWQAHHGKQAHEGALRRRASERQFELHPLRERAPVEASDTPRQPLAELAHARLAGHLDERPGGAVDLGLERAAVELIEPDAAPPPTRARGHQRDVRELRRTRRGECDRDRSCRKQPHRHPRTGTCEVGAGDPGRERGCDDMGR